MMKREQFLSVVSAMTVMKQAYHNHGQTTASITIQRMLKNEGGQVFDSAKLTIHGPTAVFVAIGGILWGVASALGCRLHATAHGSSGIWELTAHGEAEPMTADEVAEKAFGG